MTEDLFHIRTETIPVLGVNHIHNFREHCQSISDAEAIQLCIEKFEFLLQNVEARQQVIRTGAGNTCALCQKYLSLYAEGNPPCAGCPIYAKTCAFFCHMTPYMLIADFVDNMQYYDWYTSTNALENIFDMPAAAVEYAGYIRQEIEFLKGLLEEKGE